MRTNKKWISLLLAFVMILTILPLNAFADEPETYDLTITVTPKDGVTVDVKQGETPISKTGGVYKLKAGNYIVSATKEGYYPKIQEFTMPKENNEININLQEKLVTVEPKNETIQKGGIKAFTAKFGDVDITDSVTWKVTPEMTSSTDIEKTKFIGNSLWVSLKEPSAQLTVTATLKSDSKKSGTATVTVLENAVKVNVTSDKDSVAKGLGMQFNAKVINGNPTPTDEIEWAVSGVKTKSINTRIDENGYLSVGSDEPNDKLKVTATIKAGSPNAGISGEKTVQVISVAPQYLEITNAYRDGNYVKGKVNIPGAVVKLYRNGSYPTERIADGNGNFNIHVENYIWNRDDYVIADKAGYAPSNKVYVAESSGSQLTQIYPTSISLSDNGYSHSVSGYYNVNTYIKVYYDGKYIGDAKTDAQGYFTITSNLPMNDKSKLKFYIISSSVSTKTPTVTKAVTGEDKVEGTSAAYANIEIKDSNGNRLGITTADANGKFTVNVNRKLISGEKLTVTASETGKKDASIIHTVANVKTADLVRISYIKGFPDGNFYPYANMTRAEAATMFARLLNNSDYFGTSKITKFGDANNEWYSEAINYVVAKGLISGYPDGTFKPNARIKRGEFAQMIGGYITAGSTSTSNFKDVKDHWAKDAIEKVYGNKSVKGYPDGTFKPNADITRAEAVTILNAVFGRVSSNSSFANVTNSYKLKIFRDINTSDWFYANVMDSANAHKSYRTSASDETEIWTEVNN